MTNKDADAQQAATARRAQLENDPAAVAANNDPYPEYVLTLKAVGFDGGNEILVQGPHTALLMASQPDFRLKVEVTHNPTVPPVPNLTITITKQ